MQRHQLLCLKSRQSLPAFPCRSKGFKIGAFPLIYLGEWNPPLLLSSLPRACAFFDRDPNNCTVKSAIRPQCSHHVDITVAVCFKWLTLTVMRERDFALSQFCVRGYVLQCTTASYLQTTTHLPTLLGPCLGSNVVNAVS